MYAYWSMVNDFGEAIAAFVASAAKELNITNINWKGAAPHLKIGLPLNSLFL